MSIEEIEAVALELPGEQLDELIGRLAGHRSRPPLIREAWLGEAERRMEFVRSGSMRLLDADAVLADPDYDD